MSDIDDDQLVGRSVLRVEDLRILTGRARYVDDVPVQDVLHAAFARSPWPHGRLTQLDVRSAGELPGVAAVFTGADLEPLIQPGQYGVARVFGGPGLPEHTLLATDRVRVVGDPVAIVVASSRAIAEDALQLIEMDCDPLDTVLTEAEAHDPSRPPIFEALGSNVFSTVGPNLHGPVEAVFDGAHQTVRIRVQQHRHQPVPMECRACVCSWDERRQEMTVWSSNQSVRQIADGVAAALGLSPSQVRVLTDDVGGSFGLKVGASREEVAVAAVSRAIGRPVKWVEDRLENLVASGQAREESLDLEAAIDADGAVVGLKASLVVDAGAYPGMGAILGRVVEGMLPGPYTIDAMQFESTTIITNKDRYVAYRGPWAIETFARERLLDAVARATGQTQIDVRLRNVVEPGLTGPRMITGRPLAGVTVKTSLERVAEMVDFEQFRARQRDARAEGRYLGVGVASFIEGAPGPGHGPDRPERVVMELTSHGKLLVYSGQMPHGQGHETTLAQVAAKESGVDFDDVVMVFGDSSRVPDGVTGGSRAAAMAGGVVQHAGREMRKRLVDLAALVLEAEPSDIRLTASAVSIAGTPSIHVPLRDLIEASKQLPPNGRPSLCVDQTYAGGTGGWSGGTHCAFVEVDIETGQVRIDRYVVVEDCGEIINPAVVDGQIRGGVAQGIGAVLLERSAYDDDGQCVSSTLMDYLLPTATDVPRIEIVHLESVHVDDDVRYRGVGEGGMIAAPATLCSAIEDALEPFGVVIREQHLPPCRIIELLREHAGSVSP